MDLAFIVVATREVFLRGEVSLILKRLRPMRATSRSFLHGLGTTRSIFDEGYIYLLAASFDALVLARLEHALEQH
jgi:hypothetical protein